MITLVLLHKLYPRVFWSEKGIYCMWGALFPNFLKLYSSADRLLCIWPMEKPYDWVAARMNLLK